ncbi:MBL fold metallo-hydrolase [Pseudosporangium ferrugineum]|uniref:Glyoxylase-like metal-dependent hydrolase (Beta-lactamase superfamily II) n=1 Tax=Pseudosporangium ferrugineum TaxID=439699 RepID=A0A2T0SBJ3_9ACTN|nr:MBL fold metallo-hydrolase [Pseudosporangium ferrugineum]PRY30776.1 glyoxylase-like metal-dependent hydrolase (beta-lactamase superfamily II) [Pseudosporangium ferrugineum]
MTIDTDRRSFLARAAALAAAPTIASLVGNAMLSSPAAAAGATDLPDFAPVPPSALGPALNGSGYYVGRIERNLYWVTNGTYIAAFLTTRDGVVLLDAPPALGGNIQRAIDEVTRPAGLPSKVTHLIYSHHHSDHIGASALFGKRVTRIGHTETRRLLKRDADPDKPAPDETFDDHRTLRIGGERIELHWLGANHTPDNIFIHLPGHRALMLVDVLMPGWAPFANLNLSEDVQGALKAPAQALKFPWAHFIGGHMGRLGTRRDLEVDQAYTADLEAEIRTALAVVDPAPYFARYADNPWAAVKTYLDEVVAVAIAPVVRKYTGVLAAADVFADSSAFVLAQSLRLDLGVGQVVQD